MPLNPNSSKKNMTVSISVYFYAIISYFGTLETLFIQGLNFTNFFDWYSQIYTNY